MWSTPAQHEWLLHLGNLLRSAFASLHFCCCRQQLQDALTVVEAGLSKLQPSDRCDHALSAPSTSSSTASSSMLPLPHFNDILMLRVQAQLLLALSDANKAVAVLGTAVRRLAHARRALDTRQSLVGGVAAELLQQQEAQVGYMHRCSRAESKTCAQHPRTQQPATLMTYASFSSRHVTNTHDFAPAACWRGGSTELLQQQVAPVC